MSDILHHLQESRRDRGEPESLNVNYNNINDAVKLCRDSSKVITLICVQPRGISASQLKELLRSSKGAVTIVTGSKA